MGAGNGRPSGSQTFSMGIRPGINLDKALQLAAELEDEEIMPETEAPTSDRSGCQPPDPRRRRPVVRALTRETPGSKGVLSGDEAVGLAWSVIVAFVRLTHAAVHLRRAAHVGRRDHAGADLGRGARRGDRSSPRPDTWSWCAACWPPSERAGISYPDAHLAALAIEHGATLASRDHDFGRFRGLKWVDPLAR